MSEKIKQQHLERGAYVYVRQSTPYQVRNNLESKERQYALEAPAGERRMVQRRTGGGNRYHPPSLGVW